jgi:hypothetical protein
LIEFEIGWSLLTINTLWRRLLCCLIEVTWRTTVLHGYLRTRALSLQIRSQGPLRNNGSMVEKYMNGIIYLVGLVVVVGFVLSYLHVL